MRTPRAAALYREGFTLSETIDSLVARTWDVRGAGPTPKIAALRRVTQRAVADRLLTLAADSDAAPEVRAVAEYEIARLRPVAQRQSSSGDTMNRAHWLSIASDFTRWLGAAAGAKCDRLGEHCAVERAAGLLREGAAR